MDDLKVSVRKVSLEDGEQIAIIKVGGYVEQVTASELQEVLNSLLRSKVFNIIIDLTLAEYVSSAGWGLFLSELRTIRENDGDLKLAGMQPHVYEVFDLLELCYILKAYNTLEDAVADFRNKKSPPI